MSDNKHDPIIQPENAEVSVDPNTKHDPVLQADSKSTAVTVDTESTITPISREEIKKVDATDWNNMTVGELYDQLQVMEQRKYHCQVYAPLIVGQIESGIRRLRLIIDKKQGNEVKLL